MGFEDLDFGTISDVLDSWERLRRTPDYDTKAGTILFSHLFEKRPKAKTLFGFPLTMDPSCQSLQKSRRFVIHAKYMISMLDKALNLLGPDAELLAEIMSDLGQKHVSFGIEDESYYSIMGDSLFQALSEILGKHFTPEIEQSWTIVYGELSQAMIKEIGNK